jgi:hypothetical protein
MNGLRKCGLCIQWTAKTKNESLSFAGICMELENIILSEVRCRRPKVIYFLSYVEYRPKTNTAILWKEGHSKGGHIWEGEGKRS